MKVVRYKASTYHAPIGERPKKGGKPDLHDFNHKEIKMLPSHVHWWDLDVQRSLVPLQYHQCTVLQSSPNAGVPAAAPHLNMNCINDSSSLLNDIHFQYLYIMG